jgi:hypothetical protein
MNNIYVIAGATTGLNTLKERGCGPGRLPDVSDKYRRRLAGDRDRMFCRNYFRVDQRNMIPGNDHPMNCAAGEQGGTGRFLPGRSRDLGRSAGIIAAKSAAAGNDGQRQDIKTEQDHQPLHRREYTTTFPIFSDHAVPSYRILVFLTAAVLPYS